MPNETSASYHKRIVYGKLVDKTLADIDYSELAELVYGQPYSSDVARRMMYGSCRTLQLLDSEREAAVPEVTEEIKAQKLELQKERQRFFDQRRELNKIVSELGRNEHLYNRLIEAANGLDRFSDLFACSDSAYDGVTSGNEAVLVLCDWHYGMVTSNIWNHYDTDVCVERIEHITMLAAERLMLHHCDKLHIVVLGDLIHGGIHTSARVASNELVCDQLIHATEILAQCIAKLSRYVGEVVVYTTYGNHARSIQNKADNIHRDNMERIIPWWLRERFDDVDNVTIAPESETEVIYMDICGHGICAAHGDLDGVKSSPRLFSTIFSKKYNKNLTGVILGDKHHEEGFEELGIKSMTSDALCGTDEYANGKRLYSTPGQLMLVVNEAEGIDATYHLKAST